MAKKAPSMDFFIKEYMIDLNATQAAIRAGYSPKTAYSSGQRLLKKPKVKEELARQMKAKTEKLDITSDYVLSNLKTVAERCMQGEPILEYDKETGEYIPTGEWKFDASGANRSLELLGKYLKLFTDKVESSNTNTEIPYEEYIKKVSDENEY